MKGDKTLIIVTDMVLITKILGQDKVLYV
ncbi:uncharacterized protein METZ01_LOCUS106683 [marine metagenome]|uniref:Uncharacterized protein n=1 Tax=marine metagenome TaxID=408172 RepID=A0A381WMR8_9ZZZZ